MPSRAPLVGLLRHVLYLNHAYMDSDVMTFWTYAAGAPSVGRRAYERAQIIAWISASWRSVVVPQVSANRLITWDHSAATPVATERGLIFPAVPGTITNTGPRTQNLPMSAAAIIALRTQPAGSPYRDRNNGRIFHTGLTANGNTSNFVENDTLNASFVINLQTAYNALRDRLKPATDPVSGTWSVVSFRTGDVWRAVPIPTAVNHCLARPQVGTQRRRMPRVGPYARGA